MTPEDLIQQFTSPITPASPAGENLEYDPRMIGLDEQYAGEPEHMMGDAFIPAAPPDWRKLEKEATILMKETRDLRLIVIWTVARLANKGIEGLLCGLQMIQQLSEHMWEQLWPIPDDGDVQERISALTRLSPVPGSFEADTTVLRLLLEMPLTASPALGSYGLRDIQQAHENSDTARTIRASLLDTPAENKERTGESLDACIDLLKNIRETYAAHGMGTPDFRMLTDLLKEMQLFLQSAPAPTIPTPQTPEQAASPNAPTNTAAIAAHPASPSPTPSAPPSTAPLPIPSALPTANPRVGRDEAVRLMQQLCDWFEENEPSSPVPYFLKRAIRAVGASFVELMADIAPIAQEQINTVLKPQTPSSPAPGSPSQPQQTASQPAPTSEPVDTGYFSPFG